MGADVSSLVGGMGSAVGSAMGSATNAVGSAVGYLFPGSNQSPPPPPPRVVLVPPMFQRDTRGMSRFCRSSYDYLGARKQLSRLLADHLSPGLRGGLRLSPPDDPRVSVRAALRRHGGSMVLRWQPASSAAMHTFVELASGLENPGDVCLRASLLHPGTGLGAFLTAPLAKQISGELAKVGLRYSSVAATAGAVFVPRTGRLEEVWLAGRLGSLTLGCQLGPVAEADPTAAAAAPLPPTVHLPPPPPPAPAAAPAATESKPASAAGADAAGAAAGGAAAARPSRFLPALPALPALSGLSLPFASSSDAPLPNPFSPHLDLGSLGRMGLKSLLLAYSPLPREGAPVPSFTASVEMRADRSLTFSFYQHVAATRHVVNPFEEDEVVGITNYLDIGLQLTTAVATAAGGGRRSSGGGSGSGAAAGATAAATEATTAVSKVGGGAGLPAAVNLAVSWQVNKNWLVKGRVGSESAAAAVGVRVWHAVSAYLTASVSLAYATGVPRYGAELVVENFGPLRYERGADDVAAGRALLQRHEASPQDLANFAGRGVLIRRSSHSGSPGGRQALTAEEEAEAARVAQLM